MLTVTNNERNHCHNDEHRKVPVNVIVHKGVKMEAALKEKKYH